MSLLRELKECSTLTERELELRNYLLSHPENIQRMSSRQLGDATFTSAATVTRFCKKFGCNGWPEFKLRFVSDLKSGGGLERAESIRLSEQENMVTLLKKTSDIHEQALETTQKELSLTQLLRIQKLLLENQYIDFYAYDTNIHLARYASSQFFHAGKIAVAYSEMNVQVLSTLGAQPGHLAILISHTGENGRLIELARLLRRKKVKVIAITSGKETTLAKMADEFLYAPTAQGVDRLWATTFFAAAQYLLDLMFSIAFSGQYAGNMALNQRYETIGDASFWNLRKHK